MACYSNGCKSMCAKVVVLLSVIFGILGIVTAAFGAMQSGVVPSPTSYISFDVSNARVGKGVLILGVVVIITSLLGCATAKFKKPWFAILFIILTLGIGLALLIIGVLSAFGGAVYDAAAATACRYDKTYETYRELVDQRMCRDDCKCFEYDKSLWESQEEEIRARGAFDRAGRNMDSFEWSGNRAEYVESWEECYDKSLRLRFDYNSKEEKFLREGGYKFIAAYESEYDCGGVCETPLFYMSRKISDGPPTQGCIEAAARGLGDKLGNVGLVALVTGLMMLIAMIGACPLCTGFSDK
jgi:hypothetical protein